MKFFRPIKKGFSDFSYYYIIIAAAVVCVFMSFFSQVYLNMLYSYGFAIPCMLFLVSQQRRGRIFENRKYFILSGIMVAWFLILQVKRSAGGIHLDNIGLFLSVYLFAFPLAAVLREGEEKTALKIFSGAFLVAAVVLSAEGLMLLLGCLPEILDDYVYWDGDRLVAFWHPNITGCFLMIGIIFCTTFLMHQRSCWARIGLSVILVLLAGAMALTSCRTVAILTGGYLGALIFFMMIRRGRKWFVPAVLAALVVAAVFYSGERSLYEANGDRLIREYTQAYSEQISENALSASTDETEPLLEGAAEEETIPVVIDPETGDLELIYVSPQGSIMRDLGTLNSRTKIWRAVGSAVREDPSILLWGVRMPGKYISANNFFPTDISHMHNAWIECLMGMGLVGLLIAVLFTLMTVWNCVIVLLRHHQDVWKRGVALLELCLLATAVLEPYLFYITVAYNLVDMIFFLCAGYLAYWQEADNRRIMGWIRSRISFTK